MAKGMPTAHQGDCQVLPRVDCPTCSASRVHAWPRHVVLVVFGSGASRLPGVASRRMRFSNCGRVNVVMSPFTNVALCKGRMLAPNGRCKTFDASADGYVRGEGCGLVVLKRLSLAQADGDRILAVIRGSAVNHDGRSAGLTVPYGPAQEAVIRRALAVAQIQPHEIDYLEAHGTGTSLGDPIEFRRSPPYSARRSDRPLWLGSVKTNLGHLESAAGIAGLLKTALALQQEEIPPHLHFQSPNPMITLDSFRPTSALGPRHGRDRMSAHGWPA